MAFEYSSRSIRCHSKNKLNSQFLGFVFNISKKLLSTSGIVVFSRWNSINNCYSFIFFAPGWVIGPLWIVHDILLTLWKCIWDHWAGNFVGKRILSFFPFRSNSNHWNIHSVEGLTQTTAAFKQQTHLQWVKFVRFICFLSTKITENKQTWMKRVWCLLKGLNLFNTFAWDLLIAFLRCHNSESFKC